MKKSTIWIIAIIMGFSFLALLYMQLNYIQEMVDMKKEQFDESVNRALYQASRNLELNETLRYLEKDVNETERRAFRRDSVGTRSLRPDGTIQQSHQYYVTGKDGTIYSSFELKTITVKPSHMPKGMILNSDKSTLSEATKSLQEIVKNRYIYQKALLDEVVYSILYSASEKPLNERINFKLLDQDLKAELMNNGINIPYHFTVSTQDGREVYRCPDYTDEGEEYSYSQLLFRNDPQAKMGVVKIHFPDMDSYIFSSVRFMIPSIAFTMVLIITFIFTIVIIFRQKRYTEIKNDFINNMTHELKTPIASISLAAQMLNDESVTKSPTMMQHLGGVINDESKRLRFLVEKVLQMSMFDRKKAVFKKKKLNLNEMVENITHSFTLRVEHTGGKIYTDMDKVLPRLVLHALKHGVELVNLLARERLLLREGAHQLAEAPAVNALNELGGLAHRGLVALYGRVIHARARELDRAQRALVLQAAQKRQRRAPAPAAGLGKRLDKVAPANPRPLPAQLHHRPLGLGYGH